MLSADTIIAIIGGGPGGLTLARLLQLNKVNVKVYERDFNDEARVQGATLDLHAASGLKAIRAAGLLDAFRTAYRPGAGKGRVIDKYGNIIYDEHSHITNEDLDDVQFRPEIDRGPLRDLLLDSLQPGTVVWDSQFLTMSPEGMGWTLHFKNGTTAFADIVIGADGANSRIRPFVTSIDPVYAGTVIIQGNVPHAAVEVPGMYELLKGGKIYGYGDGRFLHVSSKGDGSIDFYMSSKKDENWWTESGVDFSDSMQVCEWFRKEYAGWGRIWYSLIEKARLPLYLRPQYCMPLEKGWGAQPNVTLLGDAAHIMPPSGEGVNLAMLDALELSEHLMRNDLSNTQQAIAAYEGTMRDRAEDEMKAAMEMTDWMHAEGAEQRFVELYGS